MYDIDINVIYYVVNNKLQKEKYDTINIEYYIKILEENKIN